MTYRTSRLWQISPCAFVLGWAAFALCAHGQQTGLDVALGRQLATECASCHGGASSAAIPKISGRNVAELIALLMTYASGKRPNGDPANPTMVSVAQSLDAHQMAAVARYLAQLAP